MTSREIYAGCIGATIANIWWIAASFWWFR
jgi:hypothetical protein